MVLQFIAPTIYLHATQLMDGEASVGTGETIAMATVAIVFWRAWPIWMGLIQASSCVVASMEEPARGLGLGWSRSETTLDI